MSLVAYAVSSDEESGESDTETEQINSKVQPSNGHITDEDDFGDIDLEAAPPPLAIRKLLSLPAPTRTTTNVEDALAAATLSFDKLPTPKTTTTTQIVEEDDEFLHKKEIPPDIEKPKPPALPKKGPVKITIPSLSEFKDLDKTKPSTSRAEVGPSTKSSSLLSLLPQPKHVSIFETPAKLSEKPSTSKATTTSLIPDSVKNQAARKSSKSATTSKKAPPKRSLVNVSDGEDSDEAGDFFSLNSDDKLPEVSEAEISAMVAKRAAQMAEAAARIDQMVESRPEEGESNSETANYDQSATYQPQTIDFDDRAMQALVGSRAKRQKVEATSFVELSANEVLPNKDEWLRTALASATSYQPRGVLVDEEPAPGTRKKHQITYLAHQAKANELELQAMWSANRHTRRQTQGKYGF